MVKAMDSIRGDDDELVMCRETRSRMLDESNESDSVLYDDRRRKETKTPGYKRNGDPRRGDAADLAKLVA